MRRRWVVMVLAGAVVVWCAAPLAVARASTWGKAIEVPGLGSLNQGGNAQLASVSCASAGNCTAGGFYRDGSGHGQAFVVRETNGTWAKAIEVPGSGTLDAGGGAEVKSVSCATAGNCAAIGVYNDGSGKTQAFVVSKANGVWGNAIEVPGLGTLNKNGAVATDSVSCASAGNCAAGGFYTDGSGHTQAFVVSKANGTWAKAIEVPGSGTLNTAGNAAVDSVSCASAGNCVAAGGYDGSGHLQAFVVRETNGSWRGAFEVPGSGALNFGGFANADSVSCASVGNCAVGGSYTDGGGQAQAFVASERNGIWGKAIEVPGSGTLPAGQLGNVTLVSCASAGNCTAGLTYTADFDRQQAFVASETNGTWGNAIEIPGLATLNAGGNAAVTSVSCGAAGNCAVVGSYTDGSGHTQAFVVSQA